MSELYVKGKGICLVLAAPLETSIVIYVNKRDGGAMTGDMKRLYTSKQRVCLSDINHRNNRHYLLMLHSSQQEQQQKRFTIATVDTRLLKLHHGG